MEIIFAIIAICAAIFVSYASGRIVHNHRDLMRVLAEDDHLRSFNIMMTVLIAITNWIFLCAMNNSFWHLQYYFKP